ncbi:M56 family metallopeptidase [Aliikangiella sp. IMCC44359]|uniref:M56 family metallopeptidase n=1 Tax=Aliikangiella sp. IMCC44359 TaxID=3459125 RepID=UPI00403B3391
MEIVTWLTVENLIANLAQTLIHFCWQATLVGLLLKIILVFSDRRLLHFRYYASLCALVTCIIAPVYTFYILWQNSALTHFLTNASLLNTESLTSSVSVVPISETNIWHSVFSIFDMRFVVLFWGVGVCMMLLKLSYDLSKTFKLTSVGVMPVEKELKTLFLNLSSRLGIKREVHIFKSTLVNVPVVIGWLKPTVLLPIAITVGLDKRQLELIIAHELAHVRRLDFLVNLIQGLLQAFFFFHPCVYWINKVVREEREYICDSLALASVNHRASARLDLAKALLKIEELKEGNLSLAVAASDGHLKNRISRIVFNEKLKMPSVEGFVITVIGLVFSFTAIAVSIEFTHRVNNENYDSQLSSKTDQYSSQEKPLIDGAKINTKLRPRVAPEFVTSNKTFSKGLKKKHLRAESEKSNIIKNKSALKERLVDTDILMKTKAANRTIQKQIVSLTNAEASFESVEKRLSKPIRAIDFNLKISSLNEGHTANNPNALRDRLSDKSPKQFILEKQKHQKLALLDTSKSNFKQPKAISTPYPVYPAEAYSNKLSGMIKVDFTINEYGRVVDPRFSEGVSWLFAREIRSKLMRWRYKPATKNGSKIAFNSSVFFEFELPEEKPLVKHQVGTRIRRKIR